MKPSDYNKREFEAGRLTQKQIEFLGKFSSSALKWQDFSIAVLSFQGTHGITPNDGKAGPVTRQAIDSLILPKCMPVEPYNGREALISCSFGDKRTREVKRNGIVVTQQYVHMGSDIMHRKVKGDLAIPGVPIYHGGGDRDWWMPTAIRTAAAGSVASIKKMENGHGVWIDHHQGERTLYLHLAEPEVRIGQELACGEKIGLALFDEDIVWPPHLHVELSVVGKYAPRDIAPWLGMNG